MKIVIVKDERFSNHAVQGFSSHQCPCSEPRPCFAMATGFGGGVINRCENLTDDAECSAEQKGAQQG